MPKKPLGGSGEAGFYRRGLPNRPLHAPDDQDDPKAFDKIATDMMIGARKTIEENPTWGVSQAEVDGAKEGFLELGRKSGLRVLEDKLEAALRYVASDRDITVSDLALSLAYLQLTEEVNEDHLDSREDR